MVPIAIQTAPRNSSIGTLSIMSRNHVEVVQDLAIVDGILTYNGTVSRFFMGLVQVVSSRNYQELATAFDTMSLGHQQESKNHPHLYWVIWLRVSKKQLDLAISKTGTNKIVFRTASLSCSRCEPSYLKFLSSLGSFVLSLYHQEITLFSLSRTKEASLYLWIV